MSTPAQDEHDTWLAKIDRAASSFRSASERAIERRASDIDGDVVSAAAPARTGRGSGESPHCGGLVGPSEVEMKDGPLVLDEDRLECSLEASLTRLGCEVSSTKTPPFRPLERAVQPEVGNRGGFQ